MDILDKVSTPYQRTWSVVVTDGGVSVLKQRVSGRITEDKESGGSQKTGPTEKNMWSTPTAFDSTNIKGDRKKASGGQIPPLQHQVKMWPSPRVSDTEGGLVKNVELENGTFSRKNKKGVKWGVKLKDAVNHMEQSKMWPTPSANEDAAGQPGTKMQKMLGNHPEVRGEGIGTLNPTWVEWLMGFPTGYTVLKPSETQ